MSRRLKEWVERLFGRTLPVSGWGKLFRFALRQSHKKGTEFLTFHARPKLAKDFGAWSDPNPDARRVVVVVQGPIVLQEDFTVESVRIYQKTFAGCQVVVSTWEGEDAAAVGRLRDAGADLIFGSRPSESGQLNVNLQLASARAGVARARALGAEYVLKSRSDQRIYAPNAAAFLVDLLRVFPVVPGFDQKGRIVTCGRSGWRFGLYQLSDQIVFGYAEDMEKYFSAPPRPVGLPENYRDLIGPVCQFKSPEAYLAASFLQAIGRSLSWTLWDSWRAVGDHFCVVDWSTLDVYWPKYGVHIEHDLFYYMIESTQQWTFPEWLRVHTHKERPPDLKWAECALELSLRVPLPVPAIKEASS